MNSVIAQQQADSQHPWIELASFTEGDREFFAGRGEEIEQLRRLVRRDTLDLALWRFGPWQNVPPSSRVVPGIARGTLSACSH